jgi:hypothetical protein
MEVVSAGDLQGPERLGDDAIRRTRHVSTLVEFLPSSLRFLVPILEASVKDLIKGLPNNIRPLDGCAKTRW